MSDLDQVQALSPEVGLTRSAYQEIRRAILSGALPQGSMTSVRALSEALGISRTPVREALVELANDRLVAFERNRGVRICVTQRHDVVEIFELRLLLEVPSVERAVERMGPAEVRDLRVSLDDMKAHMDDEASFMHHDWLFHRKLLQMTGNERLVAIIEGVRNQTRTRGISTVGRSRPLAAIVGEHQAIYDAVERGDAAGAAEAMAQHLRTTQALLLAQEEPGTTSKDDQEAT